jgi:predicted P-loop ATPase
LCREDAKVAAARSEDTIARAREEFGEAEAPQAAEWMLKLETDRKGDYMATRSNLVMIMQHDELLTGSVALDELAHRARILRDLPWGSAAGGYWDDADDAALRHYIEKVYNIDAVSKLLDARVIVQEQNKFHPIREYLAGLTWDGVPRVDTLLIDYLGAEDSAYVRAVTRKTLCAAVARVYEPGVKFDWMLVLIGAQGIGKSTLVKKLGGPWYTDSLYTLQGKEAMEQIQGFWIIEMGELAAMRHSEIEGLRQFLSRQEDTFRVAYGRNTETFPRQCVFIGTTNDWFFLRDRTGNRRFWPVEIPREARPKLSVWAHLTTETIGQIWAEAQELWQRKEALQLSSDIEIVATQFQAAHAEDEPRAGQIAEYLNTPLPEDWNSRDLASRRAYFNGSDFGGEPLGTKPRDRVCIMEVWQECFGGDPKSLNPAMTREIHEIVQALPGWKRADSKMRFGALYGVQ